jgi:SAM-dependent methyltransferase
VQLSRQFAKCCDLADFADPALATLIPRVAPGHSAARPHRKAWEYALGALFLRDVGLAGPHARVLDVGAGTDPLLYWLASEGAHVTAADVYGDGAFAGREAPAAMLRDPAAHAPGPYPVDRLEVRYLDGTDLQLDDETFDAVVSFSSIEHFGGRRATRAAMREMARVLRPGGWAFVVTEVFLRIGVFERTPVQIVARLTTGGRRCAGAAVGRRATEVMTRRELLADVVAASGLRLVQRIDFDVSAASLEHVVELDADQATRTSFPHVVLGTHGSLFTSVAVPLWKPDDHSLERNVRRS